MDAGDDDDNSGDEVVEVWPGGSYSDSSDEAPPAEAVAKGSTRVSRVAWEIIRTSDSVIRQPCAVQVDALLDKMKVLRVAWEPVGPLQTAHRLLSESRHYSRLVAEREAGPQKDECTWYYSTMLHCCCC